MEIRENAAAVQTKEDIKMLIEQSWLKSTYSKTRLVNKNVYKVTKEIDFAVCMAEKCDLDKDVGKLLAEMHQIFKGGKNYYKHEYLMYTIKKSESFNLASGVI